MAQLIQLRQRIKAIQTIKKVTHAMRLIAMSSHSRAKVQFSNYAAFVNTLKEITNTLIKQGLQERIQLPFQAAKDASKTLLILIGSQKGLCGTFNANIAHAATRYIFVHAPKPDILIIGQRLGQALNNRIDQQYILEPPIPLHIQDISSVTTHILSYLPHDHPYRQVVTISMRSKTFLAQHVHQTTILPLHQDPLYQAEHNTEEPIETILTEPSLPEVLEELISLQVTTTIEQILMASILAEQAARFMSMDQATRNATTMLEQTQRTYNKVRQAKITQELTELSSSF